jgi:hypothetical protein
MDELTRALEARFGAKLRTEGEGMTLTKAELADMRFEKVGLNKREAKDMVEAFFAKLGPKLMAC